MPGVTFDAGALIALDVVIGVRRAQQPVLSSDPYDLTLLDPDLRVISI
jgi:hypothetical protein